MKKSHLVAIAASLALVSPFVSAEESLPLKAVNRANEVIDAALEAHGGAEAIANLKTMARKSHMKTLSVNQSFKPGEPWDEYKQGTFNAIDLENEVFRSRNTGSNNGFDFDGGAMINGDDSYNLNFRAGTMTAIDEPDFNTTSGPFTRITAALLIKQLQNRRNTSHWLGETQLDGRKYDVVTLVMEVGPALSLYFDQESHLLTRSERALPPFGQVEYHFKDYKTVDDIQVSQTFELTVNGDPNLSVEVISTEINPVFKQYAALPTGLQKLEAQPPAPTEIERQEIAEGVFLIGGGGTYAMFVEMDDSIVAIGGTAGIAERLEKLREVVKDKPVSYGLITHHHNDHVLGVAPYQAENATVLAVKEHESVVRAAATEPDTLKLQLVDGKHVIEERGRSIEIHDIGPTPHSEHLLVAWLPKERVLFEADHFNLPMTGPVPPAQPVARHLAKAIAAKGLDVKYIVGAHSARVNTAADLAKAVATQPVKMSSVSP